MLNDEIPSARALEIAISAVHDAMRMHRILQTKLKNGTLKYQYDAVLTEEEQHLHLLNRLAKEIGESEEKQYENPVRSPFGDRLPEESTLERMTVTELLQIITGNLDYFTAECADLASRVIDESVKALLHELSEISFRHKSKALTDLHLMKLHSDYL